MKVDIVNEKNTVVGQKQLPVQFAEPVREDLIEKAFRAATLSARQPHGTKPEAGKRSSAEISRRRHNYRGSYGFGISRVPRKIMSRRGTRMNWVGAFAPGTVGGRQAHPPKASKLLEIKINHTERRKSVRSAMSASMNAEIIKIRGHKIPKNFPFVMQDSVEKVSKTKDVIEMLSKLGFGDELGRLERTIRSGKGKMRGRKYQTPKGPLFVVSKDCPLMESAINIPGVEVVKMNSLNVPLLAPGAMPGRLTIYTEGAIDALAETGMFNKNFKGPAPKKKEEHKSAAKKQRQIISKRTNSKK